ncbi:hypothetical protein HCN51_20195 [Nonomuraea sp. FMUSA5-5]|uniref:DUF998 domain-containing protein n=1 Tax=Nonomuraea composti TaxID=2720023 RepID=A0ABX1B5P4_9ACTN|nr:hypothetical protein [Nonomuraea sp. FMUSA5-5]NJP91752.1 hypothetical protein [Nonomuraea sp. FMUSA5-5]
MNSVTLHLPTPVRGWAAAGGVIGLLANAFLILFFVTARPWGDTPGEGWFGLANDVLVAVQYAALVPVILALGRLMPVHARVRAWTWIGLAAAVTIVVLQVLLVAERLAFESVVVPVSVSGVVSMCWAGAVSVVGARAHVLHPTVTRLGRAIVIALPIAVAAYGAGVLVTGLFDVPWAWAAGAVPGVVVWTAFPAWVLVLGVKR